MRRYYERERNRDRDRKERKKRQLAGKTNGENRISCYFGPLSVRKIYISFTYLDCLFSISGISVPRETQSPAPQSEESKVPLSSPPRGAGARPKYTSVKTESSTLNKTENNSSIGKTFCMYDIFCNF